MRTARTKTVFAAVMALTFGFPTVTNGQESTAQSFFGFEGAPNPFYSADSLPNDNALFYRSSDEVTRLAMVSGGIAFLIELVLPSDTTTEIDAELIVRDLANNVCYSRKSSDNLVPPAWKNNWVGGSSQKIGIYWNGIADGARAAIPATYIAELKVNLSYTDSKASRVVVAGSYSQKIAIRTPDEGSPCGNGILIALFPPLVLKLRRRNPRSRQPKAC